ncbi:MAG: hypothetical protein ACLFUQ_06795 [Candidatus Izemoplasmataceae bacterium]
MRRMALGFMVLVSITVANFFFYAFFKPEEVLLNQLFAWVFGSAGRDFEPSNVFEYVFHHAFGDAMAVLMMMLFIALLLRLIRMEASIWMFRLILVTFLVFETLQIVLPGNFKWVDMAAYIVFYFIGLRLAEWVLEKRLHVSLTRILGVFLNRD